MATSDYRNPSLGSGYHVLSDQTEGVSADTSMNGTNTISGKAPFGAPGHDSEATSGVADGSVPDVTDAPVADYNTNERG